MIRAIIVGIFLCAYASAVEFEELPEKWKEILPQKVRDFLKNLTDDEKTKLEEYLKHRALQKKKEELAAELKKKAPKLAAKLEKLHDWFDAKVKALGPEAKAFVEEHSHKIRSSYYSDKKPTLAGLAAHVKNLVEGYKALSDAAKADFQKQFPLTAKILTNEKLADVLHVKN